MVIRVVTSVDDLLALRPAWQQLFDANANHTPFQTWEWNYAWWKHFGTADDLHILVAEANGEVIGIAPLCRSAKFRGLPFRHLTFISRKRADYLDFLVRPGEEMAFFSELFTHLQAQRAGWQFIDLCDLKQSSSNFNAILTASAKVFRALTIEAREVCVFVPLAATWEAYFGSLAKKMRSNIGRTRRALESQFAAQIEIPTGTERTLRSLSDFASIHTRRWKDEHGSTYFEDPAALAFERELCRLGTEAGWYRLYMLYANGKPIAGNVGYVCGNRYYAGLIAKLPEFDEHSAGTVLLGRMMQDCIENGWSAFDMTRGDEHYKHRWNGIETRNFHLRVFANRASLIGVAVIDALYRAATEVKLLHRIRAMARRFKGHKTGKARPSITTELPQSARNEA
jgi:CelD/BcsL family acetyltransferase involved in cellulose biosynthesis